MTSAKDQGEVCRRGSVRARSDTLQVRVFTGQDPVTGRDRVLSATAKGPDRAVHRRADKVIPLPAEVDKQRVPETATQTPSP